MELWGLEKKCTACGFGLVVQVCHVKALSAFEETELVGACNAKENLVYLCPNHHALLDKGLLQIQRVAVE